MSDILSQSEEDVVKIVSDDEEISNPIFDKKHFDFIAYSETLAGIITNTTEAGYSIGIYGEWGSGKTTLMKLIEKKLKPIRFYWKDIEPERPNRILSKGKDIEPERPNRILSNEIKNSLKRKLGNNKLNGLNDDQFFRKSRNGDAISISNNDHNLSIKLNSVDPLTVQSATLELDDKSMMINDKPFFQAKYDDDNNLTITENNENILTVWFNAWRYESEESYALIPLMKTLAYAIGDHSSFSDLREKIIRALSIIGKDILRRSASSYFMTEKGITDLEKLQDKFDQSIEFDKNMMYFDGMKKIEEAMNKILTTENKARIVIFIDDLDRCSPEHALEVFESIKVFLNIKGFVFVLGLSLEALNKLIEVRYQNLGLSGITGDQYIRKIIQVEVQIPTWTDDAIDELIDKIILKRISRNHRVILSKRKHKILVRMAIEKNPREVKRYFNKLAVIMGSEPSKGIYEYLVFEALSKKWNSFFKNYSVNIMQHPKFLEEIENWSKSSLRELKSYQRKITAGLELNNEIYATDPYARIWAGITTEFLDKDLWNFVHRHIDILRNKDNVANYNIINETSNVLLANPSPVADIDLRSRRREAYKDLWPRFKLLFSDSRDPDITHRGRKYIKDYASIREFSERLQNWYYDLSGGMIMNENSREAFFDIRTYIQSILASNAENARELKENLKGLDNLSDDQLVAKIKVLIDSHKTRISDKVADIRTGVKALDNDHDEHLAKNKIEELRAKVDELSNIFNEQIEARIEELESVHDGQKVEDKIEKELETAVEELDDIHEKIIEEGKIEELKEKIRKFEGKIGKFEEVYNEHVNAKISELGDGHNEQLKIKIKNMVEELKKNVEKYDSVENNLLTKVNLDEVRKRSRILLGTLSKDTGLG
jgi:energy-coupling factor transporter ATP-binding protein EcfA2